MICTSTHHLQLTSVGVYHLIFLGATPPKMTSKSSNDEDEDDCGYFIPWLDLMFSVDNTSTDLMLSNEELLTERSFVHILFVLNDLSDI
jgi:hypothetical protein